EPFIVQGNNVYKDMLNAMETCFKKIQNHSPRFPMIILKTLKGWTTVKKIKGQQIEGTTLAHQVVLPNVKNDDEELTVLENWLKSYHFEELFNPQTGFNKEIKELIPADKLLIGNNPHVFGKFYQPLVLPDAKRLAKPIINPGTNLQSNSLKMAGSYLKELFALNANSKNFRLFSPDETYSNRLDEVFQVTSRAFTWPIEKNDRDLSPDGRVMEMLSEHNMHGLAQGYVLTGRHAIIATYEAFAQIFSSMAHTYQKFLKHAKKMPWRQDLASLNYILTATAWRQEHNGYSHQNPSFLTGMLEKHGDFIKVYFPADDNSMLAILEETLSSKSRINIIVAGKTPQPRWQSLSQAREALKDGLSIWDFASDGNPDIVLVGIGDYVTTESLAAIALIKQDAPDIRIRFVNVLRLSAGQQIPNTEKYFTKDKPVIINFHAYPESIEAIISKLPNPQRFSVHGYIEEGAVTTPFEQDPQSIENWQWSEVIHADLLKNAKTLAIIGLSDKPERESFKVGSYFMKKGFKVIPVNPNIKEVLGQKAYPDLLSIPKDIQIDIVDVFRRPEEVLNHMKEIIERGGIKTVWLQEGVSSREVEDFAEDYGLTLVTNCCIMEAYKRLERF
ncbi:CoA-binding protein, partial [Candidatus Daviesbacteria bacterium]|nr:CoA-binding protein [Candidatus Daviesbacteria bacterium]